MNASSTAFFLSGDTLRSRSVSDIVLSGTLDIPVPPASLLADWQRETSVRLDLEPGDVETMPFARTRMRWPDYKRSVQALYDWTHALGLPDVLASSDVALMACRGARYHHDGEQYGGAAFCNLFLSEDRGLDVVFPATGRRIPLRRGTALIFDTCQPHGVVRRGRDRFDVADFSLDQDFVQIFLTWELAIENVHVGRVLDVAFDIDRITAARIDGEHVRVNGVAANVCPETGRWLSSLA